ncbi:Maleylacetoacetate isomerase [Aphelenchoides bicaudatus]|nr:Maleylacetoacetate isomerase [Aphelenchoides bicaudatus]
MSSSVNKPILFSYWRSSCSWRVRIALELKHIPYEYRPVNLLKREQVDPEFLKLNPLGFVPAFLHNGEALSQSLAIIEYLDESFPDSPQLIRGTPAERAQIRSLALILIADTQPVQNLAVLKHHGGENDEKKQQWAKHFIERGLRALEKQLEKTAGKYSFGDKLSLIDVCIPPQVYNARRFKVEMNQFPIINRIDGALAEIAEFGKAAAQNQPDAVI